MVYLTPINLTLKNWIWDVLEIDWTDIYILQDNKEINLPVTIVVPIYYKLRLRQLFWYSQKDTFHLYMMLKQRKSWFHLESTEHK